MSRGVSEAERSLLEHCRQGDERAWGDLYRQYAPRMARFLRGTMGRDDVDDLVQRVFLEFLSSIGRFRGESSLATWLYRIATHVARKEMRTRGRHRRKVDAYAEHVSDLPAAAPDGRVQARRRLNLVAEAVAALEPKFREVWVLREIEGLSVEECAEALGIRQGTVRTRHHRARERIIGTLKRAEREGPLRGLSVDEPEGVGSRRASVGDEQEVLP